MDGVVRAVMVAGHTVGTVAVPKWTKTLFYTLLRIGIVASHRYVAQRTDFSAQAARDATVVYRKLLVGNQQAIEQSIGNVGVEARHLATDHINNLLALLDSLCHHRQTLTDGIDFATLILRSVKTESREVDIRLGHHKREGGIKVTGYAGLASHGGVIGLLIAIWLYCCKTKVPGWVVLDNMGICSGIAATFIRLGNLMNSEIVGKVTDVPWAFIFRNGDPSIAHEPRHPGQLYEAITYILIFTTILLIYRHKGPKSVGSGLYFGICLTLIFVARFFIEYTKEIQEAFEAGLPIDMGQILSIPLIAIGIWAIVSSRHRVTTMNFKK